MDINTKFRKIQIDSTQREIADHGTQGFPVTVNHDDLWAFEGKHVPVHWHGEFEIGIPIEGRAVYQIYQNRCEIHPGQAILINSNVPHSCSSADEKRVRYHTVIVRPDFLYGTIGSDIEKNCFRAFQHDYNTACIMIDNTKSWGAQVLALLVNTDRLFYEQPFCYELRIKGLLCEVFAEILSRHETGMTCTKPSQENTTDLVRLEKMLDFLHTHFDQIISLQELANQVHLSREASCRIFKKMTGKTITQYLCEYRVTQSLSFVQSRQYSITQIAEMTGFSNASRFAKAFQAYIGCNPSEYNLKCQQEL